MKAFTGDGRLCQNWKCNLLWKTKKVFSAKEEHILIIPFRICTVESRAEFGLKSVKLHNEDSILPMEEDGHNEEGIRKLRNVYLQLRKDLWFLSKSARPSTSVSNVLGNSFLKSKKAFYKQSYIANKILDLLISLSCREVFTLKYHAQTIFQARKGVK